MDDCIMEFGLRLNNACNTKFEELLRDYFWVNFKMTENTIRSSLKVREGFEVLYFSSANKKQFVSAVTKQVLFEVGLGDDYTVWWKEYWK